MTDPHSDEDPTILELYPDLTVDELAAAEENLKRYFAVVLRICDRIRKDPEAYARFKALTASRRKP